MAQELDSYLVGCARYTRLNLHGSITQILQNAFSKICVMTSYTYAYIVISARREKCFVYSASVGHT